jgi:hypothetical protein
MKVISPCFLYKYVSFLSSARSQIYHIFFLCWCCILKWIWCLCCYSECISTPGRAAKYCRTSDNVRLNLANVRAKVILIGHWSDHKKKLSHYTFFLLWQNPIANSPNLHFAIKFARHSSNLLNVAPEWLYILVSWLLVVLVFVRQIQVISGQN